MKGLKDQPPFAAPQLALARHQTASQDRPQHIGLVELGLASDQDFGHQLRIEFGHIPNELLTRIRNDKRALRNVWPANDLIGPEPPANLDGFGRNFA